MMTLFQFYHASIAQLHGEFRIGKSSIVDSDVGVDPHKTGDADHEDDDDACGASENLT